MLRLSNAGKSRVISVAGKDRAAIMLGGRLANAAYWPIGTAFGTSRYYADSPDILHVPVAFFGAGIKPGEQHGPASVVDIAPTLAALLGIERPAAASGRVLEEALDERAAVARVTAESGMVGHLSGMD